MAGAGDFLEAMAVKMSTLPGIAGRRASRSEKVEQVRVHLQDGGFIRADASRCSTRADVRDVPVCASAVGVRLVAVQTWRERRMDGARKDGELPCIVWSTASAI